MEQRKKTKVKFEVTFEVDVEDWNLNYGTETVREVQKDVREYLRNLAHDDQGGLEYLKPISFG